MESQPDLHPAITALAPLLGTWYGHGSGDYPTIEPFDYLEEIAFTHVGKPFLSYSQRTRSPDGQPMHAEAGYLRVPNAGRVEVVIAQPSGIAEIDEGAITDDAGTVVIELASTAIGLTGTAKDVAAVHRSIRVGHGELTYTVSMAAMGCPLQPHLTATLRRVP